MNKPRYRYKEEAKALLAGKYEKPLIVLIVFYVINIIIASAITRTAPKRSLTSPFEIIDPGNPALNTILNIVEFFIGAAIVYGVVKLAIYILQKKEYSADQIILSGFKENFLKNAFLQFMRTLFTILWTMLLIIPGIVKAYAYSMSFYLLNKEPDLEAMAAIDKSKNYTRGYKADLFMLDLSYLGWYFIGLFTFGILWLWVIPKHQVARVMYFEEIYEGFTPEKMVQKKEQKTRELPELY